MDIYQVNHQQLLKGIRCNFQRYLYKQIQWDDRLIGIFGSQGVGKTTLLLQRIKQAFDDSDKALYLNLDSILFQREKMVNVAMQFYKEGGTHLFLDSVHRYADWMTETRKLLDRCPNLNIVFASSSLLPVSKVKKGFKNQVSCYTLATMSFREYLSYECVLDLPPVSLDDLLENHVEISRNVNDQIVVAPIFRNYLEHGCYPFYWDDPDAFPFRLQDRVREMVDVDLPPLYPLEYRELKDIKRLMMSISGQIPDVADVADLATQLKLERTDVKRYFDYLTDAVCIRYYQSKRQVQNRLQKTYIGNTNLLMAFEEDVNDRVILGETFFVDQLSNFATVELFENNDFLINDKYIFMVGDPLMDYDRIKELDNAFAAIYGQPKSQNNKLPIWLLGLCY